MSFRSRMFPRLTLDSFFHWLREPPRSQGPGSPAASMPANRRNKYLAIWEYANGTERVRSFPANLQIARSNLCNFKCVYCTDHRPGNDIPRTRLDGAQWDALMKLVPRTELIAFHGISEFLIDPAFFDIVAQCAHARVALSLNTNGSVCTPRHVKVLVEHPAAVVMTVSVDAASAQTFRAIRGWDFDRVLANIRTYVEAFRGRPFSWITLSFVITKTNVHEMADFVRLAASLGVNAVRFNRLHEYGMNWRVTTKTGGTFDYQLETTRHYAAIYNSQLDEARQAGEDTGIHVELPAPFSDPTSVPPHLR